MGENYPAGEWHGTIIATAAKQIFWLLCMIRTHLFLPKLCCFYLNHYTYISLLERTSTYKFERQIFRYGRRNEPKFGTHVRIDTLPPTPGGFSGLLDVVRSFVRSCHGSAGREAGRTARPRMTYHTRTTDRARPRAHDHA